MIPYCSFTFRKLINEVVTEGLSLCNDLNLKNQLKNQKLTGKKELGQFYNQFGTNLVTIPSSSKNKVSFRRQKRYKNKSSKPRPRFLDKRTKK